MESDEELMAAIARGDEHALGILIGRHAGSLLGFLLRVSRDRDDAEDLLQDTWMRVARGARSFDATRSVRPWLYGIAANLARDAFRRRGVRVRAGSVIRADGTAQPLFHPIEQMDMRERLLRLPDRLREVLVLRFYEGFDETEMAEALGIPRGTVKSRLHAAIGALRRDWKTT